MDNLTPQQQAILTAIVAHFHAFNAALLEGLREAPPEIRNDPEAFLIHIHPVLAAHIEATQAEIVALLEPVVEAPAPGPRREDSPRPPGSPASQRLG
jgi:hypothetical protein